MLVEDWSRCPPPLQEKIRTTASTDKSLATKKFPFPAPAAAPGNNTPATPVNAPPTGHIDTRPTADMAMTGVEADPAPPVANTPATPGEPGAAATVSLDAVKELLAPLLPHLAQLVTTQTKTPSTCVPGQDTPGVVTVPDDDDDDDDTPHAPAAKKQCVSESETDAAYLAFQQKELFKVPGASHISLYLSTLRPPFILGSA